MSKQATSAAASPQDDLVPDPQVWRSFGITSMTLHRWDADPALNFPPPIRIRNRKFRSRKALEQFKARLLADAIANRNRKMEVA